MRSLLLIAVQWIRPRKRAPSSRDDLCEMNSLLTLLLKQTGNDEGADAENHKDAAEQGRGHLGDGCVPVLGASVLEDVGEFGKG